jgi:arylformamidase
MYVQAFANAQRPIERYTVPGIDHFDELNVLADDSSTFFAKTVGLIRKQ